MCKVSDKIKLCTCSAGSINELKHFWILHRYSKTKNEIFIGELVMPYMIDGATFLNNKTVLLKRINEADAFDIDLSPKNKDRIQLTFTCPEPADQQITYGYSFKKGIWVEEEFDPLTWSWHHEKDKFGIIDPALR